MEAARARDSGPACVSLHADAHRVPKQGPSEDWTSRAREKPRKRGWIIIRRKRCWIIIRRTIRRMRRMIPISPASLEEELPEETTQKTVKLVI
ncbi:hypothetical protein LINPERPRIM_LOCUS5970 [Linum perenne]